ncbi:polysaccharide biosynthesis protein [Tautonia sociabilis]|uniref:Polysaccharide biosynthesis protein n=2 Tax=Tautonia sociabilis TaxID=2080755 RepID=A0A432MII5_9BACT|nr:polysaccharide biosynthesis protein [Tautonia sociabilis]
MLRAAAVLSAHAAAFAVIYVLAFALRFDGRVPAVVAASARATLPLVVGLKLLAVLATGTYRGWWRTPALADLVALVECAGLGSLAAAIALLLPSLGGPRVPRSVLVIDGLGTVGLLCGARVALRMARERYYPLLTPGRGTRALVVGAGEAGAALVRAVQGRPELGLRVVGIVDDEPRAAGRVVAGVRVLGGTDRLEALASRRRAEVVLIPTPSVPPRQVRELVDGCNAAGLRAQVVPGVDALLSGRVSVRPRDVAIEDLLGREPVRFVGASVGRFLSGKGVLVTGAAGSIGSEICRQALAFGPRRIVLLDTNENGLFYLERELRGLAPGTVIVPVVASVRDACRLRLVLDEHRPEVVFHAAAHKHVPMMEANPAAAVANNVLGTRTVVDEAIRAGVEAMVLISTDKAVNPTSVMGATKRLAELYVQSRASRSGTRLVAVRFGNVLGSNGSVVPTFQEQIRRGGPVTVTHPEMTRYFMTIPEASQLVLQAGALGRGGEIFVLDMGRPVRIVDLARDLIRLSGLSDGDIEIAYTGLRPGEKLFEELHGPGEPLDATRHPKIFVARSAPPDPEAVSATIDRLASQLDHPPEAVVSALAAALPEFRPRPARPSPREPSPAVMALTA